MELNFNFELKENPYKDDSSKYLIWGKIILSFKNEIIIDYEWDILEVVEWFFTKKKYLLDELIFEKKGNLNILEVRENLYDTVDDETSLDYIEKLEDYFSNHTFRLKGTPLGTYYIGIFDNNLGQISFKKNGLIYSFDFNMSNFISDTEKKIYNILEKWNKSLYKTNEAIIKIQEIKREYPEGLDMQ